MRLAPLEYGTVRYIADHMREWDRREAFATQWDDDPDMLTRRLMAAGGCGWVAGLDRPIAAIGAVPVWPGVWSVWMLATDDFGQIGKSLTKFAKRSIIPAVTAAGCHRAECRSLEGHAEAHRWLEFLGAEHEATLRGFGKGGEDFRVYAWRNVGAAGTGKG